MKHRLGHRGITLIEFLIAAAVMGTFFLVITPLVTQLIRGEKMARRDFDLKADIYTVTSQLQKFVGTSDARFYAWHGYDTPEQYERPVGRVILPIPGKCADDLNQPFKECADDVALLYTNYNRSLASSVSAICQVTEGPPGGETHKLIIDAGNEMYGKLSYTGNGFQVTNASIAQSGILRIDQHDLLASFYTPKAVIIRALDRALPLTVTWNTVTKNYEWPAAWVSPQNIGTCEKNLQPLPNAPTDTDYADRVKKLYVVPFEPLNLHLLTGGAKEPGEIALNMNVAMVNFPHRVFKAHLRSMGRTADTKTLLSSKGGIKSRPKKERFAIFDCHYQDGTGVTCNKELMNIHEVSRVRIEMGFKTILEPAATEDQTVTYELYDKSRQVVTSQCVPPACKGMNVQNMMSVVSVLETPINLISGDFSLVKLEMLSRLKVRIQYFKSISDTKKVENEISTQVVFP